MSKYNAKKVEYKGITFDSKAECKYFQLLEKQKELGMFDRIELQPKFELQPKYGKQRPIVYVADFALWKDDKLLEVIDVKCMATSEAKLKAKMFRYQYRDVYLTWICEAPKYTGLDWIEYDELVKVRRQRKKEKG